jgi:hypothetical protein
MQKRFLLTTVTAISLCLCGIASADTPTWTGDFDSSFMAPLNWDLQKAPTTSDTMWVKPGSYFEPVFNGTGTTSVGAVYVTTSGHLTVASGNLRFTTATADSGGIAVYTHSLVNDGITVNSGATLTSTQNVYVGGHGNGTGCVTVKEGGKMVCSTLTVGYSASDVQGLVNVFGGTLDMGTLLRIAPYSAKAATGRIDLRNGTTLPGLAFGRGTNIPLSQVQQYITDGYIVSAPGFVPVAALRSPDANYVDITVAQVYYASQPSPVASGGHLTYSAAQTLSWNNPLPRIVGNTVTSNVYFGTTPTPTTLVASGITAQSITVSTSAQTTYYWRVDSIDDGVTTTGPVVWTFDTVIAPTVTVGDGGNHQAALQTYDVNPSDPNTLSATVTLHATATDDGYPGALTYTWVSNADANVTYVTGQNVLNPTVRLNYPKLYTFTFTASDTANTTAKDLSVQVFGRTDTCNAAQFAGNFGFMTADVNHDCKVNITDLSALIAEWLVCNSPDCK